ncbi:hypothetical protein VSDG_06442 [Cytospora chrysosperma]|uniref:Uncharacterized protein n=1 Tax=Cytospora chrysosperma TaxID=252740 RepID=A0A423VLC7_CYTCH|nr:hypothetical protein VSDG_06442 [Valsa sordida]
MSREWIEGVEGILSPRGQPSYAFQGRLAMLFMGSSSYGAILPMKEEEPCCELGGPYGRPLGIGDEKKVGGRDRSCGPNSIAAPSHPHRVSINAGGGGGGRKTLAAIANGVASSLAGSRGGMGARKKRVRFSREVEVRYFGKDECAKRTTSTK